MRDGSIPSAVRDTGATSTAGAVGDPFNPNKEKSTKIFSLPTGDTATATKVATLKINVRAPANRVDIVPTLIQTLLSGSKFADAGYTAVYDAKEVNFYDNQKINITEQAVLTGYRCPTTALKRVPLVPIVRNDNTDTILFDSPGGQKSSNNNIIIPSTIKVQEHIKASIEQDEECIGNVYELPSIEQTIRYLPTAVGFPTKATWLKAIRKGNYSTWPLINVKNVYKHFPQSEETQQGHMRGQRQGLRSTNIIQQLTTGHDTPVQNRNDIMLQTYDANETMYTDQTGRFPHISSRGNRYQMIAFHVDSNSIWVEPMKDRTEGTMIMARSQILKRMKRCKITPKH
jgi:hypothetical protein